MSAQPLHWHVNLFSRKLSQQGAFSPNNTTVMFPSNWFTHVFLYPYILKGIINYTQ